MFGQRRQTLRDTEGFCMLCSDILLLFYVNIGTTLARLLLRAPPGRKIYFHR